MEAIGVIASHPSIPRYSVVSGDGELVHSGIARLIGKSASLPLDVGVRGLYRCCTVIAPATAVCPV